MKIKYNSLEELKRKKALLKKEVSEMEDLLTFENTKESLSVITNGFTDTFLKEETDKNGEQKIGLKTDAILKTITSQVKEKVISKNAMFGFADSAIKGGAMDDVIKLGTVALVSGFAKNTLRSSSWKKKLIGVALIYLAPIALRFVREKLEEYQKNKSVSSMEQLI